MNYTVAESIGLSNFPLQPKLFTLNICSIQALPSDWQGSSICKGGRKRDVQGEPLQQQLQNHELLLSKSDLLCAWHEQLLWQYSQLVPNEILALHMNINSGGLSCLEKSSVELVFITRASFTKSMRYSVLCNTVRLSTHWLHMRAGL